MHQQESGFLRLSVWAATVASATTALIMGVLWLPLHLMRARASFGVMPHPMSAGGGFAGGWVLVALLVVLVYGGVAGAIFAAIYNAVLSRR